MAVIKKGSTIKLFYKGVEETNVKVLILNDANKIVFAEKIKNTDGFVRPYNFSELPEGNYSFQLIGDDGSSQLKEVSYDGERASLSKKVMHVRHLNGSTDKFVLSVPNRGNEDISISIYGDSRELLYTGKENISGDFAKVYNLKDYNGTVTFVVTDSKGYSATVSKESW